MIKHWQEETPDEDDARYLDHLNRWIELLRENIRQNEKVKIEIAGLEKQISKESNERQMLQLKGTIIDKKNFIKRSVSYQNDLKEKITTVSKKLNKIIDMDKILKPHVKKHTTISQRDTSKEEKSSLFDLVAQFNSKYHDSSKTKQ